MPLISEYEVSRHYGGPEEGGWWYDWRTFVRVVGYLDDEEHAYAACRGLNQTARAEAERNGEPGRSSMAAGSRPDTSFTVESTPGEDVSTEVPHYS